ncbi:MAG TPA: hypothetical protein PKH39_13985 [Woeseiaceae bacterium]|nr:hypothetical protein [Woeseiaceae bacterium]
MKHFIHSIALVFLTTPTFSQELPSKIQERLDNDEVIEAHVFSNTMSTSKSFGLFVQLISEIERSMPNTAADDIQSIMGGSKEKARSMVVVLLQADKTIQKSVADRFYDAGCNGSTPLVYGDAAAELMQATYEFRTDAELIEYRNFMSTLDTDEAAIFEAFLEKQKNHSADIKIDYRKVYERERQSIDAKIAEVCLSRVVSE